MILITETHIKYLLIGFLAILGYSLVSQALTGSKLNSKMSVPTSYSVASALPTVSPSLVPVSSQAVNELDNESLIKQIFMDSCVGPNTSEALCSCAFTKLHAKYSVEELTHLAKEADAPPPEVTQIVLECLQN